MSNVSIYVLNVYINIEKWSNNGKQASRRCRRRPKRPSLIIIEQMWQSRESGAEPPHSRRADNTEHLLLLTYFTSRLCTFSILMKLDVGMFNITSDKIYIKYFPVCEKFFAKLLEI